MRQLVVIEFVTLDGVMQGLGSPDEDHDGGTAYGGWGAPYGDDILQGGRARRDGVHHARTCSGGAPTRRCWRSGRSSRTQTRWRRISTATPKYVATRTLDDARLTWTNAHVLGGDLRGGATGTVRGRRDSPPCSAAACWSAACRTRPRQWLSPLSAPAPARRREALVQPTGPTPAPPTGQRGADQHRCRHAQLRLHVIDEPKGHDHRASPACTRSTSRSPTRMRRLPLRGSRFETEGRDHGSRRTVDRNGDPRLTGDHGPVNGPGVSTRGHRYGRPPPDGGAGAANAALPSRRRCGRGAALARRAADVHLS